MDQATTLHTVNIEDEMRQSYMDYAMSVIVGRALPDVRDGLKPVQRRVLYAMMGEGLTSDKKTSKCAGVVGEVLKRLHPHGDMSVYDALVRLAQPWNLRYPLVHGQGNFGSVDGDSAAAYRYTECRMTAVAESLLQDLDKETVDFIPNFDDSNIEPVVLPTVVPNLLINGADGIAVGMATHIPPHNLGEIISATIAVIENPNVSLGELMKHVPGPDFPTGGIIYGRAPILSAYATGKGILQLRAKTHFEKSKGKSREIESIVVTEIPFQLNKARLVEKIADLINERTIDGIGRLRDESDKSGMRIVMELKRDATAEVVLNQLFKLTPMQTSFGVINLAIVEGKPVVCSLIEMIRHFVDHRRDVVVRRTQFELKKAKERMHLLEGFMIALLNLDDVIQLIKKSETPKEAREGLQSRYELSAIQAQAILDMRLQKLTGMERLSIEREHAELALEINRLLLILGDSGSVDSIIVGELKEIGERFGDPRRTVILEQSTDIEVEDLIEDEDMVVTLSHQGYMKRTPANHYRVQKRGGKGIAGASSKDEDFIEHLYVTSTLSDLLVFTNLGRVYRRKVHQIPEASRTARGRSLVNLFNIKEEETMTAMLPLKEYVENRFIFMATKNGTVKKVDLMAFASNRSNGIYATTLREGDRLIGVGLSNGSDDIILATKNGMAIRFAEDDVRAMGRVAGGVRGIKLDDGDEVVSMTVTPHIAPEDVADDAAAEQGEAEPAEEVSAETSVEGAEPRRHRYPGPTLLTVSELGFGKRSPVEYYRHQGRGGFGVRDMRCDERNGRVVGAAMVTDGSGIMLITSGGKIIRSSALDVRVTGRNTRGVKMVNLEPGEKVAAAAFLHGQEEEEESSE